MDIAESTTEIVMDEAPGGGLMPDELVRLPPLESWRMERSFTQHSRLHGRWRSFTLFNGHFLELRESTRSRDRRSVFNLAFLDPEPLHWRHVAWRWLTLTAVLLAGGVVTLVMNGWLVGVALMGVGVLTGFQTLRRSRRQLVFRTDLGRAALFVLDEGWITARETREFAALVGERVKGAHTLLPRGRGRLAAEMAEHRRLRDSGCLSARRYDRAKQRIFARFRPGEAE